MADNIAPGRRWQGQSVPTTRLHGEAGGLTTGRDYNTINVGLETAPAAQAEVVRNTQEVTIVRSHHPPAAKVGAGALLR